MQNTAYGYETDSAARGETPTYHQGGVTRERADENP